MPEELGSVYDKFIKALLADPIQKPTDDPQSTMGGLYGPLKNGRGMLKPCFAVQMIMLTSL